MIFLVSRHWQLVWQFQGWCSNIIGSSFGNRCFGGVEVAVPACLHLQYALFFLATKKLYDPSAPRSEVYSESIATGGSACRHHDFRFRFLLQETIRTIRMNILFNGLV